MLHHLTFYLFLESNYTTGSEWVLCGVMAYTHTYTRTCACTCTQFYSSQIVCQSVSEWVSDVTGLSQSDLHSINSVLHCPDAICICSTPRIPVRQHRGLHDPLCKSAHSAQIVIQIPQSFTTFLDLLTKRAFMDLMYFIKKPREQHEDWQQR